MADSGTPRERSELHRAIWAMADQLRGAVDGWDFKNFVLGTMFYRYLSESLEACADGSGAAGYSEWSDGKAEQLRSRLLAEKGCFLTPGELFCNVCAGAAQNDRLGDTLEAVFHHIESSAGETPAAECYAGLFDDFDVRSNKLGPTPEKRNEKLRKLLLGVAQMNLGRDRQIDAFGDAYEYLMTMYAGNAGKSGGEFFTPPEVSELLTRLGTVGKAAVRTVYDPACGSGSLLLQAGKVLGQIPGGFYGQEINLTSCHLCRINLLLHGVPYRDIHIACEDTLTHPRHREDGPFELIVSNPPYSVSWSADQALLKDPRFAPAGVLAPRSKGDLAFVMHCLSVLSQDGTAAIVCFPGVLYRSGAEQKIRKYLVEGGFLDAVIQLPQNLFFGTTVATCILVLKKHRADSRVLFLDASRQCVRVPNHNRLAPEHIRAIVDECSTRRETEGLSHAAGPEEIAARDYDLSVSAYVSQEPAGDAPDLRALNAELSALVAREAELRAQIDRIMERFSEP